MQAQFAAGGHFVSNIAIKYFYKPSWNKATLHESSIILPDSYCHQSKQNIFYIIFDFDKTKRNVNNNKRPRYHNSVTVMLPVVVFYIQNSELQSGKDLKFALASCFASWPIDIIPPRNAVTSNEEDIVLKQYSQIQNFLMLSFSSAYHFFSSLKINWNFPRFSKGFIFSFLLLFSNTSKTSSEKICK